jgi:hypothetical protein
MASKLVIRSGVAVGVYDDRLRPIYAALGRVEITRASDVEYDAASQSWVALDRLTGKVIACGPSRGDVIKQEVIVLEGRL